MEGRSVTRGGTADVPAADCWVDATGSPVVVHVSGTLDGRTGRDVCAVVDDLLDGGCRDLVFEGECMVVTDIGGIEALRAIDRHVVGQGARVTWACAH